jgi:hypothetical protein
MSDEDSPYLGPASDPQELERVMLLAAKDVALHGPFFRLLMEARVWIFVPPHPELVSHSRDQTEPLLWQEFSDAQGRFAPVFTSDRAAEQRAENLPPPVPMMMELPARELFGFLNDWPGAVERDLRARFRRRMAFACGWIGSKSCSRKRARRSRSTGAFHRRVALADASDAKHTREARWSVTSGHASAGGRRSLACGLGASLATGNAPGGRVPPARSAACVRLSGLRCAFAAAQPRA